MTFTPDREGVPAFPRPTSWAPDGEPYHSGNDGMSLRDYFAAQAMPHCLGWYGVKAEHDSDGKAARAAYRIADAMLAARTLTERAGI